MTLVERIQGIEFGSPVPRGWSGLVLLVGGDFFFCCSCPAGDALGGEGPQRKPQKQLDRRLEEAAKAVGGGYFRLQTPLKLAIAVRGTVVGRRLGALQGRYLPPFQCIPASPLPQHQRGRHDVLQLYPTPQPLGPVRGDVERRQGNFQWICRCLWKGGGGGGGRYPRGLGLASLYSAVTRSSAQ